MPGAHLRRTAQVGGSARRAARKEGHVKRDNRKRAGDKENAQRGVSSVCMCVQGVRTREGEKSQSALLNFREPRPGAL